MKQIMITLNQIKKHNPCKDGWAKVLKANGGVNADMDKPFPISSILESNDLDDTIWALQCLPEYDLLWRKFAWWCASNVSHLVNDERVDTCLNVVWDYSEGKATQEDLDAAWSAARTAWSAAGSAAWSAWYAARAAARAAAWDAMDAAMDAATDAAMGAAMDAAMGAAGTAAWDAARDAARDAQKQKIKEILDYGEFK